MSGMVIVNSANKRHNNLDIMRLVAAVLVIVSHSYAVVGLDEPVAILDPTGLAWGHFGILVFFAISGYLIAASWNRAPRVSSFLAKRALRIVPGLLLALVFTAFVVGPLVTNLPVREYLTSPGTWLYPLNKVLLYLPGWFTPPGLFEDSPSTEINASLWTLPVEVLCYLALMIAMLLRLGKPAVTGTATILLAVAGNEAFLQLFPIPYTDSVELVGRILILAATFLSGTTLFLLREKVKLNIWVAATAAVVAVAAGFTPSGTTAAPLLLPYVFLTVGMATPVLPLGRFRGWDLSYGTYVFAFPVQQMIEHFSGWSSPWEITMSALVVVLPLAALSWRYVERPALLLAERTRRPNMVTVGGARE